MTSKVLPVTATVTLGSGESVEGQLEHIDDFTVRLKMADGYTRSFRRDGDSPKVEVHDPLKAHRDLIPRYTDRQIHDITSYLVTIQ